MVQEKKVLEFLVSTSGSTVSNTNIYLNGSVRVENGSAITVSTAPVGSWDLTNKLYVDGLLLDMEKKIAELEKKLDKQEKELKKNNKTREGT